MRVRMPTPNAGWRAFMTEVVIVVMGILIALSLQQLVDERSDRQAAARAVADIREEIGANLGQLNERARTQACIDRRLDEIGMILDALFSGRLSKAPSWVGRPQYWIMEEDRWNAATQGGRASLLAPNDQLHFSSIYSALRAIEDAEEKEQELWAQLRALEGRQRLSEDSEFAMRTILAQARLANWRIKIEHDHALQDAGKLAILIIKSGAGSQSVCIPTASSRAEAERTTGGRYGEP